MRITKEIFITIKNVIRTIEKTGPYFSKRSRGLRVIGKVHLSLNKFKLLKNSIWINFEIVMLLHCIAFYPGAHNPNFMPQTIRFFCQNHAVITSCDCQSQVYFATTLQAQNAGGKQRKTSRSPKSAAP